MKSEELYELLKLDLTEGEAKVYLALIELGSSTVGPIVKKARVAYSNVYDILNRLLEKGLVSFIIKSKTKYFQAVNPTNLVDYLEKKEKEIARQKQALQKLLPQLELLKDFKQGQEAEVFIGLKGLKTAYEKLLSGTTKDDEDLYFYIYEKEYAKESDLFYFSIYELIKKVHMRGILNGYAKKSLFIKKYKNSPRLKIRFADFPIPGNIDICKDKVLIMSWKKPIMGVLMHSQSIADNLKEYLEAIWKISKS